MKNDLLHELYKFRHRHIPIYGIVVLFCLMLYTAMPSTNITKSLVAQGFGTTQWSCIIMIALSSDIISMEYRDNTMPTLIYKTAHRFVLYSAKFLVLILYSIVLLFTGMIFSLIIKAITIGAKFSWCTTFYHSHILLNALFLNLCGTMIYLLFIISLSLLLISLVKTNATVIIIGLAIAFLGADLSNLSMTVFPHLQGFLAWNPLNMINIINQLSNSNVIMLTHLTNLELIMGNIIYTVLFFLLGFWAFKKRPV